MPVVNIVRSVPIERTARVLQLEGLFEVAPSQRSNQEWSFPLELPNDWKIGLIVGPSGSGKSTVAKELFGSSIISGYEWPEHKSLVDGFPSNLSIKEITAALSSVGFSSPPAWLRPFRCLSNGEQFRVTLARALCDHQPLIVVDEFTSVVDRTVAQIGSAAVAKAVRRENGKQFVAVSCHYDIVDWLDPDWIIEMPKANFARRSLQGRPSIKMEIVRVHHSAWELFKHHHYLDTNLNHSAKCFVGYVSGQPAAFCSTLMTPGAKSHYREHRTVCLPDFHGVGIGNAISEFVAGVMSATGYDYRSVTSNQAMVRHRAKSKKWLLCSSPKIGKRNTRNFNSIDSKRAINRLIYGFKYVGPALRDEAKAFGVC
jgi:ABC-type thiamine transport system ATPase subunit